MNFCYGVTENCHTFNSKGPQRHHFCVVECTDDKWLWRWAGYQSASSQMTVASSSWEDDVWIAWAELAVSQLCSGSQARTHTYILARKAGQYVPPAPTWIAQHRSCTLHAHTHTHKPTRVKFTHGCTHIQTHTFMEKEVGSERATSGEIAFPFLTLHLIHSMAEKWGIQRLKNMVYVYA